MLHNFLEFNINTTAFCLGQYNLHLLQLKSSPCSSLFVCQLPTYLSLTIVLFFNTKIPVAYFLVECVCHLSSAICHLPSVICHLSSVICHLSSAICRLSTWNDKNKFQDTKNAFRDLEDYHRYYNSTLFRSAAVR